jgi:hypothetical protein
VNRRKKKKMHELYKIGRDAYPFLIHDLVEEVRCSRKNGGWHKMDGDEIIICTYPSRDPSRRFNGGEYDYYRRFKLSKDGVIATDDWSCEIAECEPMTTHYVLPFGRTDLALVYERAVSASAA